MFTIYITYVILYSWLYQNKNNTVTIGVLVAVLYIMLDSLKQIND